MKNLKALFFLLPLLALVSCGSAGPDLVAEKFIKALYTADFEGAKKLCTEDSKQAVDFVAAFAAEKLDDLKETKVSVEHESVEIAEDGNSAVVHLIVHGSLDLLDNEVVDSKEEKINLVKVEDKWLVSYKLK